MSLSRRALNRQMRGIRNNYRERTTATRVPTALLREQEKTHELICLLVADHGLKFYGEQLCMLGRALHLEAIETDDFKCTAACKGSISFFLVHGRQN